MTTYFKVLTSNSPGRRQRWYIYGQEPAMVQDCLELAVEHVGSGDFTIAKSVFVGGETSGEELRRRLLSPVFEDRSLVILLDADEFRGWELVKDVIPHLPSSDFFVAVSNEKTVDTSEPVIRLFMNSMKARLVECREMDDAELLYWIETRLLIRRDASRYLLKKAGGDTEWLLNTVRKLQHLNAGISLDVVEAVCRGRGRPDFYDSLLHYRKRDALLALEEGVPPPVTVSRLTNDIQAASLLNEAVRGAGYSLRIISEKTGISANRVAHYRPLAKLYERINSARCFNILARMQARHRYSRWGWQAAVVRW